MLGVATGVVERKHRNLLDWPKTGLSALAAIGSMLVGPVAYGDSGPTRVKLAGEMIANGLTAGKTVEEWYRNDLTIKREVLLHGKTGLDP
jgi:hypothetical protein